MTLRITEAELARDIHAVIAKVQEGIEVIVEQDHRPVALIGTPEAPGRKISESILLAKAYEEKLGCAPVPDSGFATVFRTRSRQDISSYVVFCPFCR